MRKYLVLSVVVLILLTVNLVSMIQVVQGQQQPLYVMFIWHYHQPWYYNENETGFILPWVRMHSVGNYYKMAYILSKYPDVKVTFTFSGSLLVQLLDYVEKGLMDYRQELSWKIANNESLTDKEIYDMLRIPGGFFDINWARIVDKVPRYKVLRDKAQTIMRVCSEKATSDEELYTCVANAFAGPHREYYQRVIDLAVLFNLYWIDPLVAKEEYPQVYELMEKGWTTPAPEYTLQDLKLVLNAQIDIMSKIVSIYEDLVSSGQIELIPVPYSHPLAPIIADFGWTDDIKIHVKKSIELFDEVFNYTPIGMWPAEQAINEYVLKAMSETGIEWVASDQTILAKTGVDASNINNYGVPWYIDFGRHRIYLFFRNTELSNLISFEYSKWSSKDAVNDLAKRITQIAEEARKSGEPRCLVIALDGENPWENYEQFGDLFLSNLYAKLTELQKEGIIKTITPGEFIRLYSSVAKELPLKTYVYLDLEGKDISDLPPDSYGDAYGSLPRKQVEAHVPEGSWGGGELSIWIGDRQENAAWMWLAKAREDILKILGTKDMTVAYDRNPEVIEYLLRAEASDWFWWYGWDGGGSPETFDPLFKAFLRKAYMLTGLKPPNYLSASFYPDGESKGWFNPDVPKPITESIKIDGKLDNVWNIIISDSKALNITIGPTYIKSLYLAVDGNGIILAFIPWNKTLLADNKLSIALYLSSPRRSLSPYHLGYNVFLRNSKIDPGLAIAFEIMIKPYESTAYINAATGTESYIQLFKIPVGVGDVVELSIPWRYLGLLTGDTVYVAAVTYYDGKPVETSTRLGMTYKIKVPPPPRGAVAGQTVFEMKDPEGDDDGAGGYKYPLNKVFASGVFDMLSFKVIDTGEKIRFEIQVRDLGDNPWGGPNGFCLQYIHIYIHTTLNVKGRTDTYGLNVNISSDSAWHIALLLAPGWGTDPVPKGQRAAIYYYNDTVVVQDTQFKVYADETTNTIIAEVDKSLLPDVEHISEWKYVVALTSYDGYGPYRIRPFAPQSGEWTVGAPGYEQAILTEVLPRIMDLLGPTPEYQYNMLHTFDPATKKLAVLEGIGKESIPTTTPTPSTITTTIAETITKTQMQTITSTITKTETSTITVSTASTVTSTTTYTHTVTTTKPQIEQAQGIPILYLIGGIIIGVLVSLGYIMLTKKK